MEQFSSPRIWDERIPMPNGYMRLFRTFLLGNPPPTATLRITADSNYAVWINGKFVGFDQFADYVFDKVYDTYEVASLLRAGENAIAVLGYCIGEDCSVYLEGTPGVAFDIRGGGKLLCESDGECRTGIAPEYVSGAVHKFSPQLSFGFIADGTRYDGWHDDGYVPTGDWKAAVPAESWKQLRPRPIEKLHISDRKPARLLSGGEFRDELPLSEDPAARMSRAALTLTPIRVLTGETTVAARAPRTGDNPLKASVPAGDGVYLIFDMGQEDAGIFTIDIDAPANTRVDMGFGEHLTDGRVRTYVGGRSFAGVYLCRGGRQTFTHYTKRLGCRYMQLHISAREFTLYYAGILPTRYPVEVRGAFKPSDKLHEKIYEVCRHTLLSCMHEHYEDCPWREQALYAMDSRNQMLCGYYVFGEYAFARSGLITMAKGYREDGLLSLCSPAGTPAGVSIPCFSLIFIVACSEYVLYSGGDSTFLSEVIPVCEKILKTFRDTKTAEGLPTYLDNRWNFYEWADGLDGSTQRKNSHEALTGDALISCFYAMALDAMEKLLKWSKKPCKEITAEKTALLAALHTVFYDAEKGLYASYVINGEKTHYAELTQSLMLYIGVCKDKKQRKKILDTLIDRNNTLIHVTTSHSIYKYEVLLREKGYAAAVFDEVADRWGAMLYNGATTFWETDEGEAAFDDGGSLCHAWSAIPAYLYFAYVMGIRPTAPGFTSYTKKPLVCGIMEAEATVPMPGTTASYRTRRDGNEELIYRI